jgi:hypothetical protein
VSTELLVTTLVIVASPGTGVLHTLAAGLAARPAARSRSPSDEA